MPAVALSPKAGAHGEKLCGLLTIRAALEAQPRRTAHGAGPRLGPRRQPGHRRHRQPHRCRRSRPDPTMAASMSPTSRPSWGRDVAAVMVTGNPTPARPLRARRAGDRAPDPRGQRVLLLRRGQLQRHRRAGAAGRPRRRRHIRINLRKDTSPPPRRRRAGRGSGGGRGRSLQRPSRQPWVVAGPTAGGFRLIESRTPARAAQAFGRLCAPSTARWACMTPRAGLHAGPRRRRPAPGGETDAVRSTPITSRRGSAG